MTTRPSGHAARVLTVICASVAAVATVALTGGAVLAATTWQVVGSPDIRGGANDLLAVSGTGPHDVWSVGSFASVPNGPDLPLAEHWDGSSWRVVPVPGASGQEGTLFGVVTLTRTDAWAVGQDRADQYPNPVSTLIEHSDGSSWSRTSSPPISQAYLTGVSAASADDVWAVGNRFDVGTSRFLPLFEHWDGHIWSVIHGPSDGVAQSVSADSSSDVWAIGEKDSTGPDGNTVVRPIIYRLDGTRWSVQARPRMSIEYGYGQVGIDALSPSDVWAFAMHGTRRGANPAFMHFDGTSWTAVPRPQVFSSDSYEPFGLAFSAANNGWFIGNHTTDGRILAEHWDGSAWRAVSLPNWGSPYAVAAVPRGGFWSVGVVVDPSRDYTQTLTLHSP